MKSAQKIILATAVLLTAPCLFAQASEADIVSQIKTLRSLDVVQRPLTTIKLAHDIRALPASLSKVKLADAVANLATEGDQGQDALQTAADTPTKALAEAPFPAKENEPPEPYLLLANLVRYKQVTITLDDPLFEIGRAHV